MKNTLSTAAVGVLVSVSAQTVHAHDVPDVSSAFLHEIMHAMPMLAGAAIAVALVIRALKSR